jgi:urea transport system ATP-binding protein
MTPEPADETTAPLLEICGLTVDFDGFLALDDLSLSVERGELRFLIGPNGAGKTTLLDVVTSLTAPTDGQVLYRGEDVTGTAEHKLVRKGIGRSFQTPTVFEELTAAENLDLAEGYRRSLLTRFRAARHASTAVVEALEQIGLLPVAEEPAGSLSHGQKQWLEIGMLLVQQPELLLLDEPVAGMTPRERQATGRLLEELAEEHTVVVVEHDMAFLRQFARRVTVLHEGRLLCEGSVDEVVSNPRVREVYLGRNHSAASAKVAGVDGVPPATEGGAREQTRHEAVVP